VPRANKTIRGLMTHPVFRRLLQGIIVGMAGGLISLALLAGGWLEAWEAKAWDWRATLFAHPETTSDDIRLILLDQKSLDWMYEENVVTWPWPREVYAFIVDFCRRSGAKALAFDVLFTEPSKYGVIDDGAFGDAMARFGRVAASVFLKGGSGRILEWPQSLTSSPLRVEGIDQWLEAGNGHGAVSDCATLPIAEVANASAVLCNVEQAPDADGIFRRIQAFRIFDGEAMPALGLGIYLAAHPDAGARIHRNRLVVGELSIPIDAETNAILRYRGPHGTYKSYSAAAVIQSEIQLQNGEKPNIDGVEAFRAKYVLFGFAAPGLYDLRPSPVDNIYLGVEIQATILDNFLKGDFIDPSPLVTSVLVVLALSILCGLAVSYFVSPWRAMGIGILFLPVPVALASVSYVQGVWLPLVVQEIALILSIVLALGASYATEGRQKRFIKSAFRHYLSPAVIDQLIRHPDQLRLGGVRRVLSIFFSDLQGFTAISEELTPEELTRFLNEYLTVMTDIIHAEGGTVDKYEGDAIIAFWNAPLEVPAHAHRAVRAALSCQTALVRMRPRIKKRIGKNLRMRIGINTGPAVVGNLGSMTRFDYTMLGDAVNLAARLEGANKQFSTYTMISESTRKLIGEHVAVRELARLAAVGRRKPVTVYEPMVMNEYKVREIALRIFASGLAAFYEGQFDLAGERFAAIQDQDPAAAAYLKRCQLLEKDPPSEWHGDWIMTGK
jgi:adenylate cyclase